MPDNSADTRFTLTEKQLANFLGISIDLVRHLRRTGRLPFVKINSRILYLRNDAVAFLEQHRQAVVEVRA
jgi:predicted site-specific integrase-resolvase